MNILIIGKNAIFCYFLDTVLSLVKNVLSPSSEQQPEDVTKFGSISGSGLNHTNESPEAAQKLETVHNDMEPCSPGVQ